MKIRKIKDVHEPVYINSKRKRRLKKVLRLIKYMLVTALLVTTVVYAAISPFFNIKDNGKESAHYGEDKLIEASGIREGINGSALYSEERQVLSFKDRRRRKCYYGKMPVRKKPW